MLCDSHPAEACLCGADAWMLQSQVTQSLDKQDFTEQQTTEEEEDHKRKTTAVVE